MVTHRTQGYQTCQFSWTCLVGSERADFCLGFPEAQQPSRHHSCDWVAVWPEVLGKQPLNLHGPACLGRVTDLVKTLSSKGLRFSNIQGQEEIMVIVGRKGRKKLKKIRCYGLQTHFRTDMLLKSGLMGSVQINELLRTSGFPSVVLAQAFFLRKPGLGAGGTGMHPGSVASLATVSFWTRVLPVLQFRHTVESVHRLYYLVFYMYSI